MPLPFSPTPHQCLRAAQILSCGAAAVSAVMPGAQKGDWRGIRFAVPAFAFFSAAFTTRYILQETESRLQIAVFSVSALLLERVRSQAEESGFGFLRWSLNAMAAMAGVLLAKHRLEPGAISLFVERMAEMVRW